MGGARCWSMTDQTRGPAANGGWCRTTATQTGGTLAFLRMRDRGRGTLDRGRWIFECSACMSVGAGVRDRDIANIRHGRAGLASQGTESGTEYGIGSFVGLADAGGGWSGRVLLSAMAVPGVGDWPGNTRTSGPTTRDGERHTTARTWWKDISLSQRMIMGDNG